MKSDVITLDFSQKITSEEKNLNAG
jgi:hypothetical protein